MAKKKEKSKDDRDEEERMKRIMMAATGYETVEEARQKPSGGVTRDGKAVISAKEFLEDMEDEVNQDVAKSGGRDIVAPNEKDDMKLNSVLIGGPAPKPPERRKVLHSQLASTLHHSHTKSSGVDQSMNLMDPSLARKGHPAGKGKTSLTTRLFGDSGFSSMHDADPSADSEEFILGKRHMVRYYNFICFLVVCILFMVGGTLLTLTIMSKQAPEPIDQTAPDGSKDVADFGTPIASPVAAPVSAPVTAPIVAPTPSDTASLGRFEAIMTRLVDTGFAEESKLRNAVTAQYKALDWLVSHDPAALDPSSKALLTRYVLAVLFYSTSGREPKSTDPIRTNWKQHTLWLTGDSCCGWYGIKCVDANDYFTTEGNGKISQINLPENKLKGTLPSELSALSGLISLNLKSNSLKGAIPTEFKFPAMKDIHLDYNHLNGTIGLQLEFMTELRTLSMPYNELTGSLPATIGFANKLRYIKLGGNRLTGSFPASIANLTKLETIHVSRNRLSGSIPDEFFEMKRLVNVSMSQNLFEGKLSPKLSQLSHLHELHLTGNDFSGTVPDAFDSMILLATLHLGENRLSGEVPTSLGSRHRLEKLDLTANDFVGTMPQEICDLQQTGKLYHLGADCVTGDTTALDVSSFNDNRRHRNRRLVKISRPPKDELYNDDPDAGKPRVRAGTSRLGGSFVEEDEDSEEDADIEDTDEEVIAAGDFVYLEEDGTVEDQDGNVIEGVDLEDADIEDADEEVIAAGDFVYLEEDGTVEDQDGNVIEGVDLEDADIEDADIEEVIAAGDFVYLEEDGTVEDQNGNVIEGVDLEDADIEDADAGLDADLDADEEVIGEGDFVFLDEDGHMEDKDGNVIEGIALEDVEDLDADEEEEITLKNNRIATLGESDDDHEDGIIHFTQPILNKDENADGDAKGYKIAYASQEVIKMDPPAGMEFNGIECPCCTFCLAAASSPEEPIDLPGGDESSLPEDEEILSASASFANDEDPGGSSECVDAINEGTASSEYPGLVGMNGQEAKKCLQMNTDKTVLLVRPGVRRHFAYQNSRIIIYLDRNGDVKKTPIVG
ncbi:unnamed protein product [Cylindrotheca closterium]|uniref:Leucine-rich repeat-containing N-terminal plant-type domain-containing protein n=1 Tax=Cylindrotheca closterium TaxID=2856 RepID=A0AAD2G196_9STRA|nr:unnamed protein product [Cylindrotheca closterium]